MQHPVLLSIPFWMFFTFFVWIVCIFGLLQAVKDFIGSFHAPFAPTSLMTRIFFVVTMLCFVIGSGYLFTDHLDFMKQEHRLLFALILAGIFLFISVIVNIIKRIRLRKAM